MPLPINCSSGTIQLLSYEACPNNDFAKAFKVQMFTFVHVSLLLTTLMGWAIIKRITVFLLAIKKHCEIDSGLETAKTSK